MKTKGTMVWYEGTTPHRDMTRQKVTSGSAAPKDIKEKIEKHERRKTYVTRYDIDRGKGVGQAPWGCKMEWERPNLDEIPLKEEPSSSSNLTQEVMS